eukprot:10007003-Karenia_brevis.AAC.1
MNEMKYQRASQLDTNQVGAIKICGFCQEYFPIPSTTESQVCGRMAMMMSTTMMYDAMIEHMR